jgi:hypothetical protein
LAKWISPFLWNKGKKVFGIKKKMKDFLFKIDFFEKKEKNT